MFKSKRRKELEATELKYLSLLQEVRELQVWCAEDSGELAFAMEHLLNKRQSTCMFRKNLRQGLYTKENDNRKVRQAEEKYREGVNNRNSLYR